MERKIIGLIHYRKGPNKLVITGLTQPISDAIKLLRKEFLSIRFTNKIIFLAGPPLSLILIITCWLWYKHIFTITRSSHLTIFLILRIIRLGVYPLILRGWGSNSKYALIGAYRAVSQVISYEICFITYILICIYLIGSYSYAIILKIQQNIWFCFVSLPLFITWVILCCVETNRTPFDHAERERETVSGFNVEYGGGIFALIFIAEYGMIILLRFLTRIIFLGTNLLIAKTIAISILFIWLRCSLPRVRYDKLIIICWKICLPYRLRIIILIVT